MNEPTMATPARSKRLYFLEMIFTIVPPHLAHFMASFIYNYQRGVA